MTLTTNRVSTEFLDCSGGGRQLTMNDVEVMFRIEIFLFTDETGAAQSVIKERTKQKINMSNEEHKSLMIVSQYVNFLIKDEFQVILKGLRKQY